MATVDQEPLRLPRRRVLKLAAGGLLIACGADTPRSPQENSSCRSLDIPAQNKMSVLSVEQFNEPEAIRNAVNSIAVYQPEGTYILTDLHKREIIPMDVAHVAIALTKVDVPGLHCQKRAEAGVNWFLERITTETDPKQTEIINGKQTEVSYAGSWHNEYHADGKRTPTAGRGRGESVGLMLMAIDSITQQDPRYLNRVVNGKPVHEYVSSMVDYLGTLQRSDGTFKHRPNYNVAFAEENVRMSLGLTYAAELLKQVNNDTHGEKAKTLSEAGMKALKSGCSLQYGMSYDFMAKSMWGIGGVETAQEDLKRLRNPDFLGVPLLNETGVRVFDWQQNDHLKQIVTLYRQLPNGVAETAEAGITALMAGEFETALSLEKVLLLLQKPDGSFPSQYISGKIPFFHEFAVPIGQNVVYAAARMILFDRAITEAIGRHQQPNQG